MIIFVVLNKRASLLIAALVMLPAVAWAQASDRRFEAAAHVASAESGQFDEGDLGFGARFAWTAHRLLGVEAEVTTYPGDFPDRTAFSRGRVEGFFGATAGPQIGRLRPFAKLRPGFLTYREAPEPVACILIFPPPLACALASGSTLLALDVGGGLEVSLTERALFRFDLGDRLLRYEGPVMGPAGTAHDDGFWGHDLRLTAGVGFRF